MGETKRPAGVQSVERAFLMLEVLAERGDLSLTELSQSMSLPAPTTHRFLQTLVSLGYVRQLENRRYGLGLSLLRLAGRVDTQFEPIATPYLETLVAETGESANLAILDGTTVVYVAHVPSQHAMRMFTENGQRVAAHSTGVGKAILAQLTADQVDHLISRTGLPGATRSTITTPEKLHRELAKIRRNGYAIDNEEQEEGVSCYAVPVPDLPISMGLSVSGPKFRITKEFGRNAVPLLQATAGRLSKAILGSLEH